MPDENEYIKAEFRFSDSDEMKTIEDELSLSAAKNIAIYDGLIDAEVLLSSLEVLKKKGILMDFPLEKNFTSSSNLELFNNKGIEESDEKDTVKQEWMDQFKKKAERTFIDYETNQFSLKDDQNAARADIPDSAGAEPQSISGMETNGNNELVRLPEINKEHHKSEEGLYIINFSGPLNKEWRASLNKNNIRLTSFHDKKNEYSYTAFLSAEQYDFLESLRITRSIDKYLIEKKLTRKLIQDLSESSTNEESVTRKIFEVALLDNIYLEKVSAIINSSGQAVILDTGQNIIRIQANPESPLLAALADLPFVISLSGYEPPSLFCDVCRKTIGLDYADAASSLFGDSEIIGIIDSGIDETHVDFKNRIIAALQYGSGLATDFVGHGTHVAGIICGDGTASNGKIKGIAPKSQIVSIGVLDANKKMDLPVDIGKVLKLAADNGAKIINLSWGYKLSGEYQHGAFSVDKFIYDNPEILIVVAAGNEGNAKNGFLAYKTVGVPGSAKNVLTVGATSSRRTAPVITETWGSRSPGNFPAPPQNAETLISTQDFPAVISSRGPTDYDSIKPEVVAPGTYILAAKAINTVISPSSPEYFNEHYTFKTGTSMAAPVVSGIAALIREYLRTIHNYNNPSSSLIKAIIIGCSYKIENTRKPPADNSLTEVGFPDFDQGFGMVNVHDLLNTRKIKLVYADIFNTNNKAMESRAPIGGPVKSYREYIVDIPDNTADLSVTLCWIDLPAKGVQNNLQLSVKSPSNEWEIGNMEHNYKKSSFFDTTNTFNLKPHDKYNTTEKVFIKNATAGKYLIKITAQNTIYSLQGYSLAVLGNISDFTER